MILELLGGFSLRDADGALVAVPRKAAGLLALLALAAPRPLSRAQAAALLWEDHGEAQARGSLRAALAALRRAIPPNGGIRIEGSSLALDTAVVETDLAAFERLSSGSPEERLEAISLFQGELLAGFPSLGSEFGARIASERARLSARAVALLDDEAAQALATGRADLALPLALRLVALEPLHEAGHRLLMQAFAASGRPGEAIRHYRKLQLLLRDELGAAPEPETIALFEALRARRRGPAGSPDAEGDSQAGAAGTDDGNDGLVPTASVAAAPPSHAPALRRRELRRLAVLALGIDRYADLASTLDVEALHALLETWHRDVDSLVTAAGGRVHDRTGDSVVALFGADVARLDDPVRAARAALGIIGREPRARAGLAAGAVLLADGPDKLAALGEPVVAALALRDRAQPATVLAAAPLLPELQRRLAVMAEPGGALLLAPSGAIPERRDPIVGRVRELAQLTALLEAARTGAGISILLRGEPGIGKSRLAQALAQRAECAGFRQVRAEILDFGEGAGDTPRRQLTRALLGPVAGPLGEHPLVKPLDGGHLPALHQVAGLPPPPAIERLLAAGNIRPDRDAAFRALLGVAASNQPLLLIVEDVHWAGRDALDQLAELSRTAAGIPAVLLMTVRSEEDPLDHGWRQGAGPMITIDLAPLPEASLVGLAQAAGLEDGGLARACAVRARGNPLFLEQLVACAATGQDPRSAVPGSMASLVLGRLDRLSEADRAVIAAAAILGRTADVEAVRAVTGSDHLPPADGWLLRIDAGRIVFSHALVRDAIRETLLPSEARALHAAAARHFAGRDDALAAAHLARADDPGAAALFMQAGQAALRGHRADKAEDLARRGLAVAKAPADLARLSALLANALLRQRRPAEAIVVAEAAAAAADSVEDRIAALVLAADAEAAALQPDAALDRIARAIGEAEAAGLKEPLARLFNLKGTIHFPRGELEACLAANRAALEAARAAASPLSEAGAHAGLAWAHYQMGKFRLAAAQADAALALGDSAEFDRIRLSALRVRAVSQTFLLDHDAALADAEAAMALARAQGDGLNEVLARTTAATVHLECWRPREAEATIAPALEQARAWEKLGIVAAPLWVMGTAAGALGRVDEAIAHLEAARAAATGSPAIRFALPRILGTLAFFTDAATRLALVAEGEALLAQIGVAHSALGLWGSALLGALVHREPDLVARCAAGIAGFAGPDPEPWAMAMLTLARGHGGLVRGEPGAGEIAARFHARARAEPALSWLRPVMRIVETAEAGGG